VGCVFCSASVAAADLKTGYQGDDQDDVGNGQHYLDQGKQDGQFYKSHERHLDVVLVHDRHGDQCRGGTDRRYISAQVGSKNNRPPKAGKEKQK